jgi:hypothetical protein
VKSSQAALAAVIIGAIALLAVEGLMLARNQAGERYYVAKDRERTAMVDRLVFTDSAETFRTGKMRHVVLVNPTSGPARITLDQKEQDGHQNYPRSGTWTTPKIETAFPITEVLPSWNVITPPQTGVLFHVRTRDRATGTWSPWLHIGSWGRVNDTLAVGKSEFGYIDDDTLKLDRPADAYQVRATLQCFQISLDLTPTIRRIVVAYSGPVSADSVWAKSLTLDPGPVEKWARDLKVPYRSQKFLDTSVTGMTCSPTSVSMVLHHFGIDRPTTENALAIWDNRNQMFGNWSNNTQRASELGMDAWLQRFRNWEQVKAVIARGLPVIASIRFERESYSDAPLYESTGGHLIVIRGFTPDGLVIVNDPGVKEGGDGALYPARGLAHAWFGHGGVGYVIRPPARPLPAELVVTYPATPTTAPVSTAR